MNTWIDVDKKLPKFNERVLVFLDDGIHNEIEIGELRKREEDGHIFWHFWFEDLNLLYTAAWRPLPKISKRLHNLKWRKLIKRKRKKKKS